MKFRCDATLTTLYAIILCTNSVYSLASLFLPTVFKEKQIIGGWVGLIFSMYSIAMVLISPIVGTILSKMGYDNLIATGLVFMGIAIFPLGYLTEVDSDMKAVAAGLVLRAL